jgi:acyl carrier protein
VNESVEVPERVVEVISRELKVRAKRLEPSAHFIDDLGADSLAVLELTLVLEETFDIEIPDDEASAVRTVHDAVAAVERHVREKVSHV